MIELGDKVKDLVTGFCGIAVARTEWLYGCNRITIQPDVLDKEGEIYDGIAFDEPQLIILQKQVVEREQPVDDPGLPGGPKPTPAQDKKAQIK